MGANSTSNLADWPGLRVTGREGPEPENVVPLTLAALTVTDAVPLEVIDTDCVAVLPASTFPNVTLVAFTLNVLIVIAGGLRVIANVFDTVPSFAVIVVI